MPHFETWLTKLMDSIITGLSIGNAALDWLSSGKDGEVVSAVSRAVYLRTRKDDLYWIVGENSPMHNRGLKISSPVPKMVVGSPLKVHDRMVDTLSGVSLDFSHSSVWNAPVLLSENLLATEELVNLVILFYQQFLERHQPAGLGDLIPEILRNLDHCSPPPGFGHGNIFLLSAWPVVERIISLLLMHDFHLLPEIAMSLVGLGEGLTPCGDDFVGGLLFCLHLLWQAYPETLDSAWNYSTFIVECKPRTNLISFTLLKDHAYGHALEPLHRFAHALYEGQPIDYILPFAEEIIQVGHSTDWDMLAGFLLGMTVISPRKTIL